MPAQSGANEVLRRMRRGYTVERYREIVARAQAKANQRAQSDPILKFASGSGLTLPGH